jgi:hypothetical protein
MLDSWKPGRDQSLKLSIQKQDVTKRHSQRAYTGRLIYGIKESITGRGRFKILTGVKLVLMYLDLIYVYIYMDVQINTHDTCTMVLKKSRLSFSFLFFGSRWGRWGWK